MLGRNPYSKASKVALGLSSEGLCQTPLLLHRIQLHAIKAFKLPYTGIPCISNSVLFESDSKTRDTNSVPTLIRLSVIAEGLATVQVQDDEAYILGSKAII